MCFYLVQYKLNWYRNVIGCHMSQLYAGVRIFASTKDKNLKK